MSRSFRYRQPGEEEMEDQDYDDGDGDGDGDDRISFLPRDHFDEPSNTSAPPPLHYPHRNTLSASPRALASIALAGTAAAASTGYSSSSPLRSPSFEDGPTKYLSKDAALSGRSAGIDISPTSTAATTTTTATTATTTTAAAAAAATSATGSASGVPVAIVSPSPFLGAADDAGVEMHTRAHHGRHSHAHTHAHAHHSHHGAAAAAAAAAAAVWYRKPSAKLLYCAVVPSLLAVLCPVPEGLQPAAWTTFCVFVFTLVCFVVDCYPMGLITLLSIAVLGLLKTVPSFEILCEGWGDETVWLVVAAFILAQAVEKTGLGQRIALLIVSSLARNMFGLAYAVVLAEFVLAAVVPSNTARGGGILAPIVVSLSDAMGSTPHHRPHDAGSFLVLVAAHANLISSASYLTGTAPNAIVSKAARDILGVEFGWTQWLSSAIAPSLVSMLLLPPVIYLLQKPRLKNVATARNRARLMLLEKGPMSREEWMLVGIFAFLVSMWVSATWTKYPAVLFALVGVIACVLSGILSWEEIISNAGAFDVLLWLGGLLSMANAMTRLGFVAWLADQVYSTVQGIRSGVAVCLVLGFLYFYSMYCFSMITAHISAFASVLLALGKKIGAPYGLITAVVAHTGPLCACLTSFSTGPVIIYFGHRFVSTSKWFLVGAIMGILHCLTWYGIGLVWWKIIGLY